jgi:hypothetical protein
MLEFLKETIDEARYYVMDNGFLLKMFLFQKHVFRYDMFRGASRQLSTMTVTSKFFPKKI